MMMCVTVGRAGVLLVVAHLVPRVVSKHAADTATGCYIGSVFVGQMDVVAVSG